MYLHDRRSFLKTTLAGAGVLLATPRLGAVPDTTARITATSATDRVVLGKTGIKASFLAQGTGFNGGARSSEHTRMGEEKFTQLLRHDLDAGMNFLDMADLYGSHPFVQRVVKGMPRDKYVALTKIWPRKESWVTPSGGAQEEVERFCKELGTDYLDICLIHCMTDDKWQSEFSGIREGLAAMKKKGAVRAVGVSCHNFGALKQAAEDPWVDVILARINYMGGDQYYCDSTTEELSKTLKTARANGKAVVGMKIFGAGKLTKPEQKDASLKYVIGNNLVDAMTIGMLNTDQVDDTLRRINATLKG